MDEPPAAPAGLKAPGRRLWEATVADLDMAEAELAILHRACRTADTIAALDAVVERQGLSLDDKSHPALVESRLQTQLLARLLVSLRIPDEDGVRPQFRGMRGAYRKARAMSIAEQRERLKVVK
jgi:hypothetical protein